MRPTLLILLSTTLACTGETGDTGTDTGAETGESGLDTNDTGDTMASDCVEENGVCVLQGVYTEDLHLTADRPWLLRGPVVIGDDTNLTTLHIEAGTTVYGESATNGLLIVTRSSRIEAVGTASAPIVFTPDLTPGTRSRGSWGGVVLNGRAPINACKDGSVDCEAEGEGGTGLYGGADAGDDSGTLSYVRIEFGGTEISKDNEINGLTLAGVGNGTTIDYVQVHMNLDDGVEFFGGTVDAKHLVVTGAGDDSLDWDSGWSGRVQFAVVQQFVDAGNHGIEADNNEANHLATPVSSPVLSNLTMVGNPDIEDDNFGIVLRRGTAGELWNVAAGWWTAGCLAVRDQETFDNFSSGKAVFHHARFACTNPFEVDKDESETMTEEEVFAAGTDNQIVADLQWKDAASTAAPDFRLEAGSPAATGGMAPSDSFFESVTYVGAFDTTNDWTDGWTTGAAN